MNIFRSQSGESWHRRVCSAFFLLVVTGLVQAQVAIESVTGSLQSGVEVVRVDLSQALTEVPNGFSIQSPARIALDFPNVASAMGRSNIEVNQGNLKSVSVVQAGNRTRVVLNLKQFTTYKTQLQGKTLLVVLDPVSGNASVEPTPVFPAAKQRESMPLRDLDFQRSQEGAGRVVISLPDNQVGVDIRKQGQTLVVEFMKTTLPQGLRRRLDVTDFGTPIKTVTTTEAGDRVHMVIESHGTWEHSAYQTDDQFVVEVKEMKVDPGKLTPGVGYSGQKMSLNFQNVELRNLLQVFSEFAEKNVIMSESVTGSLTLRLKDVPWDEALDVILRAKNLDKLVSGNVLWIATKEEITDAKISKFASVDELEDNEPLVFETFELKYALAKDIADSLNRSGTGGGSVSSSSGSSVGVGAVTSNQGGLSSASAVDSRRSSRYGSASRILSYRGTAFAEIRTNQVVVSEIGSRLKKVKEMIDKLDKPLRQVLIEARIVEASDTFGRSLGVKLGATDLRAQQGGDGGYSISGGNRVAFGTNYGNSVASSGAGGSVDLSGNFVNLPAVGQGGYNPATFALAIFSSAANRFLNLELSALEADGKGKVVSSPRVVTANLVKALIEQGTELPYQEASSSGATSIAFRKANLKLEVTPQITPEGNVLLKLDVTKDTVGQSTTAGFAINTKHIQTEVLVENGGTVVIGGIFELFESDTETKVPLLGDLPGVGNLFKSRSRTTNKSEMLVFITPKMMADKTIK